MASISSAPSFVPAASSLSKSKAARHAAHQAELVARSQALLPADAPWRISVSAAGRGGVALTNIPAGTTLVHESAAGWTVRSEHSKGTCAECAKPTGAASLRCTDCKVAHYCSADCQTAARPLHSFVCPLLPEMREWAAESSCDQDMMQLVAALVGGFLLEQQQKKQQMQGQPGASLLGLDDASGAQTRGRWIDVQDLVAHYDQAKPEWREAVEDGMRYLHRAYKADPKLEGYRIPDVHTLVQVCCRLSNNSYGMMDNYGGSNSVVGLGVFVCASMLNHSCYPNSFFSADGRSLRVRTIRPIAAGEEITVPYIDLLQPRRDRMAELLAHKHFLCTCERCVAEEKGEYGAARVERAEVEQPAIHECAPTDDESAAVLAAALLAAGPSSVLSPPTSTPSAVADEGINAARLDTWLKLGGVHCPKCLGHKEGSDDEKEEHKVNDEGKKKNKKKKKAVKSAQVAPAVAMDGEFATSSASPVQPGLVVWRGPSSELTSTSSGGSQKASWVCSRSSCGARFTSAQVDELQRPLHLQYERASRLKSHRRLSESSVAYAALLSLSSSVVPSEHVLCVAALTPMINVHRALQQPEQAEIALRRIIELMERVLPVAHPEATDFLQLLAEMQLDAVEEIEVQSKQSTTAERSEHKQPAAADVDEKQASSTQPAAAATASSSSASAVPSAAARLRCARQLYQRVYDIRVVACGPDHPRTKSTFDAIPQRWRDEVQPKTRKNEATLALPLHWEDTTLAANHSA